MRIAACVLMLCSKYCLYVVLLYRLCAFYGLGMLEVCCVLAILCVCKYIFVVMVLICVYVFFCSDNRDIQAMDQGPDVGGPGAGAVPMVGVVVGPSAVAGATVGPVVPMDIDTGAAVGKRVVPGPEAMDLE